MTPTKAVIVNREETVEVPIKDLVSTAEKYGCKVVGAKRSYRISLREEIDGQPVFDKLCGPFYGGPGIVRYECPYTNNTLSF